MALVYNISDEIPTSQELRTAKDKNSSKEHLKLEKRANNEVCCQRHSAFHLVLSCLITFFAFCSTVLSIILWTVSMQTSLPAIINGTSEFDLQLSTFDRNLSRQDLSLALLQNPFKGYIYMIFSTAIVTLVMFFIDFFAVKRDKIGAMWGYTATIILVQSISLATSVNLIFKDDLVHAEIENALISDELGMIMFQWFAYVNCGLSTISLSLALMLFLEILLNKPKQDIQPLCKGSVTGFMVVLSTVFIFQAAILLIYGFLSNMKFVQASDGASLNSTDLVSSISSPLLSPYLEYYRYDLFALMASAGLTCVFSLLLIHGLLQHEKKSVKRALAGVTIGSIISCICAGIAVALIKVLDDYDKYEITPLYVSLVFEYYGMPYLIGAISVLQMIVLMFAWITYFTDAEEMYLADSL